MILYLSKLQPQVIYPILNAPIPLDQQGRIITLAFNNFYVINCYQPHYEYHQPKIHHQWMQKINQYFKQLASKKALIIAGDFAVLSPREADLSKAPADFQMLLNNGLVDSFANPNLNNLKPTLGATWWPPNIDKAKSSGWRLDFWLISKQLHSLVIDTQVIDTKERLDHAPIMITFKNNLLSLN